MIKIRKNTFETNSSSSHSLSVESFPLLLENGKLYPDRLKDHIFSDNDNDILICNTMLSKLCLFIQFLKYSEKEEDDEFNQKYIKTLIEYLQNQFGFKIDFDFDYSFDPHDDNYDENIGLFNFRESKENLEEIKKFLEIIMDNSKVIINAKIQW